MVSPISNAVHTQPVAEATKPSTSKPPQPVRSKGDTVQLSKTAQLALAAVQEATETVAQTTKEANHGDRQAQRLLAKEAAAKPVAK